MNNSSMHNNIIMSDNISKTIYITVLQTLIAYFVVRGFSSSMCLPGYVCLFVCVFTINVDILNNSANSL